AKLALLQFQFNMPSRMVVHIIKPESDFTSVNAEEIQPKKSPKENRGIHVGFTEACADLADLFYL
ncbi:MAG: hypothetical protein NC328_08675, partial [Muribaculum sp.]|nr:hypothetical protein [Muribaculum sp.]